MITDSYGRQFKKLRVSLTSQCNFSCLYCTGIHHELKPVTAPQEHALQAHETIIAHIAQIHQVNPLESIRLTGGEPLINPGIIPIIKAVKKLGIDDIRMTTNGFLLPQYARQLKEAGLASANVSLDAIDPDVFKTMSRRGGLQQVLKGIDSALELGIDIKINSVIMRHKNDGEILPLLNYAMQKGVVIRFLELMNMGPMHAESDQWLFTMNEILAMIEKQHALTAVSRTNGSTANYWQLNNGLTFGIIANSSAPFCNDCDRLRLDASGNIYGCISSNLGISLPFPYDQRATTQSLKMALRQKQPVQFTGSPMSMLVMGG